MSLQRNEMKYLSPYNKEMLSFQPCKKNFQDSKTHDDIYIYIYIKERRLSLAFAMRVLAS
jgi:hypothetical protein